MEVRDKSTGNVLREVSENTLAESLKILDAGKAACAELASLSGADLAESLAAISLSTGNAMDSLSKSISVETGMPLKGSRADVSLAAREFMAASSLLPTSMSSRTALPTGPFDTSLLSFYRRSPLGTVLLSASPVEDFSHSAKVIAAAISSGNSVVCVPPPLSPGPFEELKKILDSSGLPKNTFQLLFLQNESRAMREIMKSGHIGEIVFLGSNSEFKNVMRGATGKRTIISGKSSSPVIIWDDSDLDTAAECVAESAFSSYNGGYAAARKVILREDSYEYFRNRLVELASRISVGNAVEEGTYFGPLPDSSYAAEAHRQLEEALGKGALLAYGGNISGNYIPPTILEYLPAGPPLLMDYPCVPFVCLEQVSSMDAAIEAANKLSSHVQASLFTSDIDLATSASEKLEFAEVLINEAPGQYSGVWHRVCGQAGSQTENIVDLREEFSKARIIKLKK